MGKLHRTQLLLEAEQHEALAEIAEEEGRSISDLVREIVRQHLVEREKESARLRASQAIERLAGIRAGVREAHGVYHGDLLAEVRAEREEDRERTWRDEP
jgi:predicted DNA-binding protein